jgi:PAS domain S-box-containing protein
MKATNKIVPLLAGVALLVALWVVVSFWTYRQIEQTADARQHTLIVLNNASELLSELRDAETGQRGYLLTGDDIFLEPYLRVSKNIRGHMEALHQLTLNSAAHKHLDAIIPSVDAKMEELSHVIEVRRNQGMAAAQAVVGSAQGKRFMDSIRAEMSSFIQIEEGALAQHEAQFQSNMRHLFIFMVSTSLLTLLFTLSFAYWIFRETQYRLLAATKISEDAAREYAESIINTVREPLIVLDHNLRVVTASRSFYDFFKVKPEETAGQLIYDLGNKQWDIPKLRELLETILPQKATFNNYEVEHDFATIGRRIMLLNARQIQRVLGKERIILLAIEDITEKEMLERVVVKARDTAEAANKELEAFSYSVSHDLRAPLRSINGFSQALLEEYQEKLDDTGKGYLERVCKATQKMGFLIDDLLKLSGVTKSEFNRVSVDLSKMIRAIAEAHQKNYPARAVEVTIQEGIMVQGDPWLMQIAMENLMDNALKFTGKEAHPRIEFGGTVKDGKTACFIRDNGVGFDMAYVDKLFGAFQRLHTSPEFPGTGIGLATVQRIIHRHGGQVWAEGEIGKGATFYFTLPF